MLSIVEHEKSFITLGPDHTVRNSALIKPITNTADKSVFFFYLFFFYFSE